MRLIHKGLIIVGVPLFVAVVFIGAMFGLLWQCDQQRVEEARERHFQDCVNGVYLAWSDMAQTIRQAVSSHDLAGAHQRIKADALRVNELRAEAERLKPGYEKQSLAEFSSELQDVLDEARSILESVKDQLRGHSLSLGSLFEMEKMRSEGRPKAFKLGMTEHMMIRKEAAFLERRQKDEENAHLKAAIYAWLTVAASLAAACLLGVVFLKDIVQRLRVVTDNTLRLAGGSMLLPPLSGSDEIASLDRGFHTMARALRDAMAKERALFKSSSDLMCTVDAQLRFASVNPACLRLLGCRPEELVGSDLLQLVIEEDRARTREKLVQAQQGQSVPSFENRVYGAGGRSVELLWSVYFSRLDKALYMVAHDISQRKAIERMKETFLSMVSHDMRSPLTSIVGTFKLVTAGAFGKLPDPALEKVQAVSGNVNRLLSLVNDLLDVEKLESGELKLSRAAVNVKELVARAIAEVEPLTREKCIIIKSNCPDVTFSLDGDRIIQVLVNLLANAVKFSPAQSVVTVSAVADLSNLKLSVTDQGRGVPASQRKAIFERFKQVETADGKRRSGTGLGLPICKNIVEQHGGQIGVDSEEGKGSTFWFTLPAEEWQRAGRSSSHVGTIDAAGTPDSAVSQDSHLAVKQGPSLFANLRLRNKGALLLIMPVAFELIFTAASFMLFNNAFGEEQKQLSQRIIAVHSQDVMIAVGTLVPVLNMPMKEAWDPFVRLANDINYSKSELGRLTKADSGEAAIMMKVDLAFRPLLNFMNEAFRARQMGHTDPGTLFPGTRDDLFFNYLTAMTPALQELGDYAERSGDQSPAKLEQLRQQQGLLLAGGLLVSIVICAASALLFSTSIANRLSTMEDNVRRLERDEPLNAELPGDDEVAHLDKMFHATVRALNEARRKEKAVFDNSLDVMCICSADGKLLRVNPACIRQWGYDRERLDGSSLFSYISESDRQRTIDSIHKLQGSSDPIDIEAAVVRADGTYWEGLWSLSWSAEERTIIAVVHDISERKELERMKQEFLAMVSHDMRTPLASIMTTTEMLTVGVCGQLPEKASQQLSMVVASCDRLLNLINDLLDIEKLEAGQMQLSLAPAPVGDLLKESVDSLSAMATEKSLRLVINAQPGLFVKADADRIVQVIVNLLSNAIKFSPEGRQIQLSAFAQGDGVEFQIADQGRGIPEHQLKTIFERYRQVEPADGKRHAGTGLGLPICKQIIERHGGTIGVTSQAGVGSTFYFRLVQAANDLVVS